MTRYFAFLRAINVGGHTVKMEELRLLVESLGYTNVETFIASGNLIFETGETPQASLERVLSLGLQAELGYPVQTFVRTMAELAEVVDYQPFAPARLASGVALNIAFLAQPLTSEQVEILMCLAGEIDDFAVFKAHIYWLCQKKQSESSFSNAVLEKRLGISATIRGMNTLQKLRMKYSL